MTGLPMDVIERCWITSVMMSYHNIDIIPQRNDDESTIFITTTPIIF